MIAIASTIQCNLMPRMYCQRSTESPNEAPSESSTVPTMTRAATTLRVMISMMMKIKVAAAIPAIIRSMLEPSRMSLYSAAVPPR